MSPADRVAADPAASPAGQGAQAARLGEGAGPGEGGGRPGRGPLGRLQGPGSVGPAIKQSLRTAVVTARLPTCRARLLPSFLIVGTQRGGTTSMSRSLIEHPAVFGAVLREEVHYFDNSYGEGLAWYRSHFPLSMTAQRAARAAGGAAPVAFESSPYYMFHPLAPERIARDLPHVKLLVLLRDPVERAYSGHAHEVAHGFETEPFERALELEPARVAGEAERIVAEPGYVSYSHQHHAYRARGRYAEQLERLERLFGRDRIHVIDSGDFFADPEPIFRGVLKFLGLPPAGMPAFAQRNARPRSSPMPAEVRAELTEYYRPHDDRLAAWLGREPSWRR